MKGLTMNPFLPSWEYVPDGEPHVFGDRVYLYGSHDRFNGTAYCENDYVCWSAPVNDLSDWRFDGVIYRKTQDPRNPDGKHNMWAPDVTCGPDGNYYLYYCLDFLPTIGVAKASSPTGPFIFYGFVSHPDGTILGEGSGDTRQTDPAVLTDEDGRVYLYSGGGTKRKRDQGNNGSRIYELFPDMKTIRKGPVFHLPTINEADGTEYESHPFYEASSIRKIEGRYYFIYSSTLSHELCWTVSDSPFGPFSYGGILISNANIGYHGNTIPQTYYGNTHGSVEKINGQWYVFYHRHTNRTPFSRQACMERIDFSDGKFHQASITSKGADPDPLPGIGTYFSYIACRLQARSGAVESEQATADHPYFTQSGEDRNSDGDQYIANMQDGSRAGFTDFSLPASGKISLTYRGTGKGTIDVNTENGRTICSIPIDPSSDWTDGFARYTVTPGIHSLDFQFHGSGAIDLAKFQLDL